MRSSTTKRLAIAVAVTAAMGAALVGQSVNADQPQYTLPFVGLGSDTTQDILNAFSGYSNGDYYTPVHSDVASGSKVLLSFDATDNGSTTSCVATRTGGPSFNRPNGSGAGRGVLVAAVTAGGTTSISNCGVGTTTPNGQISFARSSSLGGTAGALLAYVPFARDALSYGAFRSAGTPITDLSTTELQSIFTTVGGVNITRAAPIGTVHIYGCGIQPLSGTGTTFAARVGGAFNTSTCDGFIDPLTAAPVGQSQENDGDALVVRGTAANLLNPGSQVVIGFSVAGYIGKANGFAPGGMPASVVIGSISNVAGGVSPITPGTTPPNLSPNAAYYNDPAFNRDVYNVIPSAVINSALGNDAIKQIFQTRTTPTPRTAQICLQTATILKFGFLTISNCGDSTTTTRNN
jgi:hypothetical protein